MHILCHPGTADAWGDVVILRFAWRAGVALLAALVAVYLTQRYPAFGEAVRVTWGLAVEAVRVAAEVVRTLWNDLSALQR